jgi:hypothetical protein
MVARFRLAGSSTRLGRRVRALANYNLDDVLGRVAERGRWTATELSKATLRISDKLGEWFRHSWNSA